MFNLILTSFIFLFLFYKKILLLNEEILILLCFITFVFLSVNFFGKYVEKLLDSQRNTIQLALSSSIKQLSLSFKQFLTLKNSFISILYKFRLLGNYYYELVSVLIYYVPIYNNSKINLEYCKRLIFLNRVEQQTLKLLLIVLIQKLDNIVQLRKFYNTSIKNNYFVCSYIISLREYIQLIIEK